MTRPRNKTQRVFSSVSDEQLAVIIAKDFERTPSDFVPVSAPAVSESGYFLRNTSARGIDPMKKWL